MVCREDILYGREIISKYLNKYFILSLYFTYLNFGYVHQSSINKLVLYEKEIVLLLFDVCIKCNMVILDMII